MAAAVPLLWASAAELFGDGVGAASDVLTWWRTDPWWVTAAAVTLILLGRNR